MNWKECDPPTEAADLLAQCLRQIITGGLVGGKLEDHERLIPAS